MPQPASFPSAPAALSIVLFPVEDLWVGQVVEKEICSQAKSLEDIIYEMERMVAGHVMICLNEGVEPWVDVPPASARFRDLFEQGEPVATYSRGDWKFQGAPVDFPVLAMRRLSEEPTRDRFNW